MDAQSPEPPLAPDELVSVSGEREVLETFLDLYRGVITRKLRGVSESQARERLVPSLTTLAGLVKHVTSVEKEWFQLVLAARTPAEVGGVDVNDGWIVGSQETVDTLLRAYEQACDESRRIAAKVTLDHAVSHPRLGSVSLRWIFVHLIEETARHAGHADILREQIDGETGFDG